MDLQQRPPEVACADCGADLTPRHGRIVVTMETGGEFVAGYDGRKPRHVVVPRGEVKLCAKCAEKGIRGEKLGLFEGPTVIASRQ